MVRTAAGAPPRTYYYAGAGCLAACLPPVIASVLFLVPVDAPAAAAEAAAALALGLPSSHAPVASSALTLAAAEAALHALDHLPAPALLACATGNRASALAAIAEGRQRGWGAAEALAWGEAQRLPFLAVPALREWVAAALAAGAVAAAAAAAAGVEALEGSSSGGSCCPSASTSTSTSADTSGAADVGLREECSFQGVEGGRTLAACT
jgi:hypothetical protein